MKPVRLTCLFILPALMGFGCASVEPSANNLTHQQLAAQELPTKSSDDGNYAGWSLLYDVLYFGGSFLSGK